MGKYYMLLVALIVSVTSYSQNAMSVLNYQDMGFYERDANNNLQETSRDTLSLTLVLHPAEQNNMYLMYEDVFIVFTNISYTKYDKDEMVFECLDSKEATWLITIRHDGSMALLGSNKGLFALLTI